MLRGRFWYERQEVSVAVRASSAVLECVAERGEELEPSLESCVVVSHFAYAFQGLVIGEYAERGAPKRAAKVIESPNDAARLMYAMGLMESSSCSRSRAALNPSIKASQYTWNGRDPSATSSQ